MKTTQSLAHYEQLIDADMLEAYLNKNGSHNRTYARKVRRALRKFATA